MSADHQGSSPGLSSEDGLPLLHLDEGSVLRLVCPGGKVSHSPRVRVDKGFKRHLECFHLLVFTLHLAEVEKFVYQNATQCKGNRRSSTLTHEFAVFMVLNWEGTENRRTY